MSENDDLEQRKEDVWSMNEVRSGKSDASDTEDKTESEDNSNTQNTDTQNPPPDISDESDTTDIEESTGSSDTADTASGETVRRMSMDAEDKGLAVRDLHNVNVYLYEDIYQEMVTTFKELDSEYFATHGEELSKNKEFFNAVFRAGLQSPEIQEELELNEE